MRTVTYFSLVCLFFSTLYSKELKADSIILKVMNYNIKGLPLPFLKKKKRFNNIKNELKKLIEQGQGPHILNLQEAMSRKTKIIRNGINYPYGVRGPKGKWFRTNSGLETLSQYEIVESHTTVYKKCASYDCLSRKGVLHTRIRVPGLPVDLDLYSTHMQAGPTGDPITPGWYTTMIRELQSLDYYAFVARTHDPKNIIIHIGDFNFRQTSGLYKTFVETLGVTNAIHACGVEFVCEGAEDPIAIWERLIDHQFYSFPSDGIITNMEPIYFDQLIKDPGKGNTFSDHDATMVHYKIEW